MKIDITGDALRLLDQFIHFASLYPERLADAMWYDLDAFLCRLRCLDQAYREATDDPERKNTGRSKKEQPPLPDDFDCRFPDPIRGKIREWLTYKAERRDFYNQTGLRNLLAQIENRINIHSAELVTELISECMANNWAGIIWERIERKGPQSYGWRDVRTSRRAVSPPDVKWNDILLSEQNSRT